MIKNYNLFLLENVKLSNDDIIEIIKSLETGDNKNSKLINKLVNNVDNKGKTLLMSLVQNNNIDLVDYILKYDVDINAKNKKNENVLFYCKNVDMFNKFYNIGADPTLVNTDDRNILLNLASKNIFNLDLYKNLIGDGVDINKKDKNGNSIIFYAIFNQRILELLVSKNVKIDHETEKKIIEQLLYKFKYVIKNREMIINKFKYLFDNNLIKMNGNELAKMVSGFFWYNQDDDIFVFILGLSKYLNDDFFKMLIEENSNRVDFLKVIMEKFPHYYSFIKKLYRDIFNDYFGDFLKEHPYIEDSDKYNL